MRPPKRFELVEDFKFRGVTVMRPKASNLLTLRRFFRNLVLASEPEIAEHFAKLELQNPPLNYQLVLDDIRARARILCGHAPTQDTLKFLFARISHIDSERFTDGELGLLTLCRVSFPLDLCIAVTLLRVFTIRRETNIGKRIKSLGF